MVSLLKSFINGNDKIIDKVPPIIFQSWKRCRELSMNHERIVQKDILQQTELKQLLTMNEALLVAARPVLQHVFAFLRGKNYLLVLSNNEGYILETCGDPSVVYKAKKQIFLTLGANWQERSKGTNGVGTVLIEKTPLAIPGWTHYSMPVSFLDCWAAPIRRAGGELIGVLNISGETGAKHEHMMEITTAGAAMIEQSLQMSELKEKFNDCRKSLDRIGKMLSNNEDNVVIRNSGLEKKYFVSGVEFAAEKSCADLIGQKLSAAFPDSHNYFAGAGEKGYGRSAKIRSVFDIALRAAKSESTVLIQGESGTGKEIVARNIHNNSLRSGKPFITLNCAAIPDSLVESELFGYADGAFTGAKKGGQSGKFELANGGTIFLDEIGDMPINMQATLLRVLQQKEIYRIGDGKCREINVRVVAATNQDLRQLVDQGKFRLDLYYRLKVIHIAIPPLRERVEDIWDLAPYFVSKFCAKQGIPAMDISPEVYRCFFSHSWPGNVRQLENCIESMIALSNGSAILTTDDLPVEYVKHAEEVSTGPPGSANVLSLQVINMERATIVQAIKESAGNISAAAKKLGIGRTTLYRKLDKLSIPY